MFTVSALLIVSLYITQNQAWSRLFGVQNHAIFEALVLGIVGLLLTASRWASIGKLMGLKVPLRFYLKWTFAACFASTFFPRTLEGDSLRTIWLSIPIAGPSDQEHPKARRWRAASVVRWDRFLALLALLLIGIPTLFTIPSHLLPLLSRTDRPSTTVVILIAIAFGGILYAIITASRLGELWCAAKTQIVKAGLTGMTQPWRTGLQFSLSIIIHLLTCQALWLLARGLQLELGGSEAIDLIVFSGLVALVPISLNGAGLRELVFAAYFHFRGWETIDGVLLGVLITGVQTLISMSGSLHFFQIMNSFRLSVPARRSPDESSSR